MSATSRALIIGIDQYGGPPNDLTCSTVDADAVARLLRERYGFGDVRVLTDDDAAVAQVDEELQWLFENPRMQDRLVFYFSGHGFTKRRDGVLEECLVLPDGFLESDDLVAKAAGIPPGVLTVILDAGFAGGTETYVADPADATPELETVRVKTWVPVDEGAETATIGAEYRKVTGYRRFGCAPTTSRTAIAQTFAGSRGQAWPWPAPVSWGATSGMRDGAGFPELNGLVISASLGSEPAVANTSRTDGLSSFTFALIQSVETLGDLASTADILVATDQRLKALGLRQTPRMLEPSTPGDLGLRRFVTMEPAGAGETLRFMSEPKFWAGVLAATAPRTNAPWAVTPKEGEFMSTSYQPMTGAYQSPFGMGQQPFGGMAQQVLGTAQPSPEEWQRAIPTVLAAVVPALVPVIAGAILTQLRSGATGGFAPWGAFQQAGGFQQTPHFGLGVTGGAYQEEVQRLLPALAPVLANVIPNIVPQIVQNILTQQRQIPGMGFGANIGGGELWQAVSQSVHEALQRAGIQPTPTVGRF